MSEPSDPPKRRLPVIGSSAPEPEEERPPWHWSGIGAVAIFIVWLPLAALAAYAVAAMPASRALIIGVHLVAFAVGCFAGGFLVGRFGGKAGAKEATVAGFLAAAVAWALAAAQPAEAGPGAFAWILILVVIGVIGSVVARWGGRFGLSRRSG